MADWSNFFSAEVGAAATLTGLIVVAISINLSRILAHKALPARAIEGLIALMGSLVVASAGLLPGQSPAAFGIEALAVGTIALVVPTLLQLRARADLRAIPTSHLVGRFFLSAGSAVLYLVAGILLIGGVSGGAYSAAAGIMLSLIAGVVHAWVLLVEILR